MLLLQLVYFSLFICSDDDDNPYMTTSPGTLTQITSTIAKDGDSDKMEIGTTLPEGV